MMTKEMAMGGQVGQVDGKVPAAQSRLRLGLLLAGAATALAGGMLLIEELTDLLSGRADLDETFGALAAIAVGLTVLVGGALLRDGRDGRARQLGAGFVAATGGIAVAAAAAGFGLAVLVDLGTAGAIAVGLGLLLAVASVAGFLAAVIDRRWGLAAGLVVTVVLVGVAVVAVLVAMVASGADVPDWVLLLDD